MSDKIEAQVERDLQPGEFRVEVPCGFVDEDGSIRRAFILREMLGADRDVIGEKSVRRSAARGLSAILAATATCVPGARIPAPPPPGKALQQMGSPAWRERMEFFLGLCGADRGALILALRRNSIGDDFTVRQKCGECGADVVERVDLSEVVIDPLPEGFAPAGQPPRWTAELPEMQYKGRKVTGKIRLITGDDEDRIEQKAQGNDVLQVRLAAEEALFDVRVDGEPVPKNLRPAWVNDVVSRQVETRAPGPDLPSTAECRCGNEVLSRASVFALLFDLPGRPAKAPTE